MEDRTHPSLVIATGWVEDDVVMGCGPVGTAAVAAAGANRQLLSAAKNQGRAFFNQALTRRRRRLARGGLPW